MTKPNLVDLLAARKFFTKCYNIPPNSRPMSLIRWSHGGRGGLQGWSRSCSVLVNVLKPMTSLSENRSHFCLLTLSNLNRKWKILKIGQDLTKLEAKNDRFSLFGPLCICKCVDCNFQHFVFSVMFAVLVTWLWSKWIFNFLFLITAFQGLHSVPKNPDPLF